jgi:hypothetical protein
MHRTFSLPGDWNDFSVSERNAMKKQLDKLNIWLKPIMSFHLFSSQISITQTYEQKYIFERSCFQQSS